MKKLLALAFFALATHSLLAVHLYSAYISYELVDAKKLEYELTVTTFSDSRSESNHRKEVELYLGYGSPEVSVTLPIVASEEKISVGDIVLRNKYRISHQFPKSAICYSLKYIAPNYPPEVINIENSESTPLEISTELCLIEGISQSKSPLLNDSLVVFADVGRKLEFNTKARDFEGDIVELQLLTEGKNYKSPTEFSGTGSTYNITDKTILWDKPTRIGLYQIRFQIDEYRNINNEKTKLGSIEVFVMAFVLRGTGVQNPIEEQHISYNHGILYFNALESESTLKIFSFTGQLLHQELISKGQSQQSMASPGVPFIVILEDKNGRVYRERIYQ